MPGCFSRYLRRHRYACVLTAFLVGAASWAVVGPARNHNKVAVTVTVPQAPASLPSQAPVISPSEWAEMRNAMAVTAGMADTAGRFAAAVAQKTTAQHHEVQEAVEELRQRLAAIEAAKPPQPAPKAKRPGSPPKMPAGKAPPAPKPSASARQGSRWGTLAVTATN